MIVYAIVGRAARSIAREGSSSSKTLNHAPDCSTTPLVVCPPTSQVHVIVPRPLAHLLNCKRSTNAPVQGAMFVLKSRNAERGTENGTAATDGSGGAAVGGGVCERRHATERVLPQSGFELEHAGSPSQEAALEEKEEKRRGGWPGRGGIGHAEVAGRARAELWAGRSVGGRTADRSAGRF